MWLRWIQRHLLDFFVSILYEGISILNLPRDDVIKRFVGTDRQNFISKLVRVFDNANFDHLAIYQCKLFSLSVDVIILKVLGVARRSSRPRRLVVLEDGVSSLVYETYFPFSFINDEDTLLQTMQHHIVSISQDF